MTIKDTIKRNLPNLFLLTLGTGVLGIAVHDVMANIQKNEKAKLEKTALLRDSGIKPEVCQNFNLCRSAQNCKQSTSLTLPKPSGENPEGSIGAARQNNRMGGIQNTDLPNSRPLNPVYPGSGSYNPQRNGETSEPIPQDSSKRGGDQPQQPFANETPTQSRRAERPTDPSPNISTASRGPANKKPSAGVIDEGYCPTQMPEARPSSPFEGNENQDDTPSMPGFEPDRKPLQVSKNKNEMCPSWCQQ